MEHLNIEQIIEFVSMDANDREMIEASRAVNTHLAACAECRDKVRAVQALYDALLRECRSGAVAKAELTRTMHRQMER